MSPLCGEMVQRENMKKYSRPTQKYNPGVPGGSSVFIVILGYPRLWWWWRWWWRTLSLRPTNPFLRFQPCRRKSISLHPGSLPTGLFTGQENLAGRVGSGGVRVTWSDPRDFGNLLTGPDPTHEILKASWTRPAGWVMPREQSWVARVQVRV